MNPEELRVAALRASRLAADLSESEFERSRGAGERARPARAAKSSCAKAPPTTTSTSWRPGSLAWSSTSRPTRSSRSPRSASGDLAGEMSFVDGTSYRSSLVAVGGARVLGLAREQLESLLSTHPAVVYHVMRAIIRTVHETQRRLSHQAVELSNYIYKQHGRY